MSRPAATCLETETEEEEIQEWKRPNLGLVEEIRGPRPPEIGACWCPGIGQPVVTTTQFPIRGGRC